MAEESTKHSNMKTGLSFDTTTRCLQVRAGRACAYCYVDTHRKVGDSHSKRLVEHAAYDGFVGRLRSDTIKALNKVGGMRMFAFGDYLRTHRKDVLLFLNDCELYGLDAKAITKNVHFIYEMHDHPALRVINLSVDSLEKGGGPVSWDTARKLRETYSKVRIRSVVLHPEELPEYAGWVDVLTLNHGNNGFHSFQHDAVVAAGKQYPKQVCCTCASCTGCRTMCAAPKVAPRSRQEVL